MPREILDQTLAKEKQPSCIGDQTVPLVTKMCTKVKECKLVRWLQIVY